MIYNITKHLKSHMKTQGLRDFTDQILDTINAFKKNPEFIHRFEHILVDEFQDVNAMQIELLDLLNPPNLFCVGDPRQSIFGWRGSDINYIINFNKKYPDCEIITLIKNYRSNKYIVDLFNLSIKDMDLPNLESNFTGTNEIKLLKFDSAPPRWLPASTFDYQPAIDANASSKTTSFTLYIGDVGNASKV